MAELAASGIKGAVGGVAVGAVGGAIIKGINLSRKTRRAAATICLYMPDTVVQTMVNDYDQVSLTQALGTAGLVAQAGGAITEGVIDRIIAEGHEIASHNYHHSQFDIPHLKASKEKLEEITGTAVIGFRMPRMYPVDEKEIFKAGYQYNSSINPTYLPGRYNNFNKPRTYFKQEDVLQIPASVSPIIRFPLFWLSFHNLPLWMYQLLVKWTIKKDNYLNIYFHPWEFTNLNQPEKFNFPNYVSKNSGPQMIDRFDQLITWMKEKKYTFGTFKSFLKTI